MNSPSDPQTSIDLTTCDREQIHFAGHVQPFGCLVSVSADWIINHASHNVHAFFGCDAIDMIGQPLAGYVRDDVIRLIQADLDMSPDAEKVDRHFNVTAKKVGDECFDIAVHATSTGIVIEFEIHDDTDRRDYALHVRPMIDRVGKANTITDLCTRAAREVQGLTGFDRVMIYKFHHDDTGEVIAEALRGDHEPYLGLHYPASDIPKQARALYMRNLLRIISDVNGTPSPIIPDCNPKGEPLDLSLSGLRAVSPVHLQYLRNMGVGASMSISIIVRGKLWGLIACHHMAPQVLNYRMRTAAELFGQMLGFLVDQHLSQTERAQNQIATRMHDQLMSKLAVDQSISGNFDLIADLLADGIAYDGIAAWVDGVFLSRGAVPPEGEMDAFVRFINTAAASTLYATDRLAEFYPAAENFRETVAGVLALPVSRSPRDYILLFRHEILKSVTWAGNPDKPVTVKDGTWRLTPRKSFEAWQELVRGHSAEWAPSELQLADSLRVSLLEVVLRMSDAANKDMQAAQERQELLIAELNHRVRNILGLIRSLISRTGSQAQSIAEFTEIVGGRIHALAAAHDLITSLNWQPTSFISLIEKETEAYAGGDQARLVIEGGDAFIAPKAFTTLALVLHELTTNSVKYGALSAPAGQICIRLSHVQGQPLVIEWEERGGPAVVQPTRQGFGTTVIERSIPFDLNGETEVTFAPEGLRVHIEIPDGFVSEAPEAPQVPAHETQQSDPDVTETSQPLSGTVLLVEDNMIIALDAEDMLRELGAAEVLAVSSVKEALSALDGTSVSFALLDVNLGTETSDKIAEVLMERGIRFAFATGYGDRSATFETFPDCPVIQKPFNASSIRAGVKLAFNPDGQA